MVTIRIENRRFNFNAGHFTIFSASEREDLHGHSYFLSAEFHGPVDDNGLSFDYNVAKNVMAELCAELDEKVLLPERSPHLQLGRKEGYILARYADEEILFLPRDVVTLPVRNVTLEELAAYFLQRMQDDPRVAKLEIVRTAMRVSTGQGQSAEAISDEKWR